MGANTSKAGVRDAGVERRCPQCDYSLAGLPPGGRCPECGTLIQVGTKRAWQARDNLTDAPIGFLRRLRVSLGVLALLGVGNSLLQAASYLSSYDLLPLLMTAAAVAWAVAVLPATTPRPFVAGMRVDPKRELAGARMAARLSQLAWPVQGAFFWLMLEHAGTPQADFYLVGARVAQLIGVVGFGPLCLCLSLTAEWAQNTDLAWRLKIASVLLPVCGAFWTIAAWVSSLGISAWVTGMVGFFALFAFLGYASGLLLFLLGQLQISSMAKWAVRNSLAAADRDQRVLERKARRAFTGEAATGSVLGELAAARGDAPLDPCPGCGYDRAGLPVGSKCPECGREAEGGDVSRFIRPRSAPPIPNDDAPLPLAGDEHA